MDAKSQTWLCLKAFEKAKAKATEDAKAAATEAAAEGVESYATEIASQQAKAGWATFEQC